MKRVRWIVCGVVGLVLLGVGGGVGYVLYHARDLPPPDLSRFERERLEIAPEENAYEAYLLAVEALDWPEWDDGEDEVDINEVTSFFSRGAFLHTVIPPTAEERERILAMTGILLARNEEALRHLREGLRRPFYQTPPVESHMEESPQNDQAAMGMRTLGDLLRIRAGYLHQKGEHAASGGAWEDACHFASHVMENPNSFLSTLVGFILVGSPMPGIRDLARDPATPPETLDKLAHALGRIGALSPILLRGYEMELLQNVKTTHALAAFYKSQDELEEGSTIQQTLFNLFPSYLFPPNRVISWYVEDYERLAASVHLPYVEVDFDGYSEAMEARCSGGISPLTPYALGRILYNMTAGLLHEAMRGRCRTEARVEGTRLVVAIHRYRHAHGSLPPTLDALVPDFLDAVPTDPYDGKPFRYDPGRAIVYAVGTNGVDHGGDTTNEVDPDDDRNVPYDQGRDLVFRIVPPDPETRPTPEDND